MSLTRQPRVKLSVAGAQLVPMECSVNVSLHQSADTFYCKLPLLPDFDEGFWADTAPIPVTISATNDVATGSYTTLLVGQADEPLIDFAQRTVLIKGRDLTKSLTDLKTSEQWMNLSNQDVITQLAGRVGLTVNFSGTTDNSGLQFDQDFTEMSLSDTCWNVIVSCAKRLGCIAFVKGSVLYIQPLDAEPASFFTVRYQRPTAKQLASGNFPLLTCARNLNLAKDVSLQMQSWRHKQGSSITSMFESKGKDTDSSKLLYEFRAPNLTKEQQDRHAKSLLRQTLSHERVVSLTNMPGDVTVNPATMGLKLTGTGSSFDQSYILANVAHHFSTKDGYAMDIGAHSQDASRGDPEQLQ